MWGAPTAASAQVVPMSRVVPVIRTFKLASEDKSDRVVLMKVGSGKGICNEGSRCINRARG